MLLGGAEDAGTKSTYHAQMSSTAAWRSTRTRRWSRTLPPISEQDDRPLIVKLTPNVTDITVIARAAQAGGADAVSCINTLVGMAIDVEAKRPVLPLKTGGLSGPAVRPVGVAAAYAVSRAVTIPVIGIGGIASGRDALEYLLAGASAVQIGTANFVDPSTASRVLASICEFAEREN